MRRGAHRRGHAHHHRRRHRHPQARQGDDAGRVRRRRRHVASAHQPHPLGPHPGPAVLLAALPARATSSSSTRASATTSTCARCSRRRPTRRTFPVPFDEVQADIAFRELVEGARFEIGPVKVSCARLNHPWIAMAYRLDCDGGSVGYVTDTAPFSDILFEQEFIRQPPQAGRSAEARGRGQAARDARRRGAPVRRRRPGHLRHAVHARGVRGQAALGPLAPRGRDRDRARGRRARAVVLFHHAPERTDDQIDALLAVSPQAARRTSTSSPPPKGSSSSVGKERSDARPTFWGVRGSIPAPGPETNRYGGNTSCVALRTRTGDAVHHRLRHRRDPPRAQAHGRRVRQGRAARRASCCRTRTGITSRASRSSRRSSCRATSSPCTGRGDRRRCSRGSSRGRWTRTSRRCRR